VVKYFDDRYSLVEATLETGRTHQIRVHFAAIGYPVVGDRVYGVAAPFLGRQFVHASKLGFRLPSCGQYVEFSSELPLDLRQALAQL
jgi:23S rRNA pseudouridine1911/1915/1917 synthase